MDFNLVIYDEFKHIEVEIGGYTIRSMLSKRVDGLILCPTISEDVDFLHNAIDSIPVVAIERQIQRTNSVITNNRETAYKIASHLIEHGYKRIGMIAMQVFGSNTRDRIDGYQQALLEHQMLHPNMVRETDYVGLSAFDAAKDLISTEKVDAIMTASQSITLGTYMAIMSMGLKIPDDVAIFGYDDLPWMEAVSPPISTTHQPIEELATKACEILFSALDNGGEEPVQSYSIDTQLIIRESCGCKK